SFSFRNRPLAPRRTIRAMTGALLAVERRRFRCFRLAISYEMLSADQKRMFSAWQGSMLPKGCGVMKRNALTAFPSLLVVLMAFPLTSAAVAQVTTATIVGTITDSSDAA